MIIIKIHRGFRANKQKLICSVLNYAVWEIIVRKAFNHNTLLTFSALQKVKLNAVFLLCCLWCQYYACWTNKHNHGKITFFLLNGWNYTVVKIIWTYIKKVDTKRKYPHIHKQQRDPIQRRLQKNTRKPISIQRQNPNRSL